MPLPSTDPSVRAVLETVRAQHPGVPFLALGQTALWDEPTKAVWRRLLDRLLPGATLIAGVHDTDYFAKTTAHLGDDQPYVMLSHDDGRTRDLWSAAGELSSLFGSESVPTRQMFLQHGVPFDWLAQGHPGGKDALFREETTAWGWRGIVYTEAGNNVVAHDVPTTQIGPALLAQLDWGFAESLACLADPQMRATGERTAETIRGWVTDFLATCSADCRLSDLYQSLLPKLYELLLGAPAADLQTTSSTELFRFNRETAARPLFQFLDAFLNPKTRAAAGSAYDKAVAGSGIYTLEEFGPGAIPFDLVIPGHGRGTVRLLRQGLAVMTAPEPTMVKSGAVTSVAQLAEAIEAAFGPDCVLVGKAVTLVDMLAAEFLVVFHETASGYTNLTQALNAGLRAAGVPLPLYPLVRLEYPTWDALASAPPAATLRLPPHLAAAFGQETIAAPEFAARWRGVVDRQRQRLREARAPRKLRDLLLLLDAQGGAGWCDHLDDYEAALVALKEIGAHSEVLGGRIAERRAALRMWREERQALEARKGADWRANIQPLREKIWEAEAAGRDASQLRHDVDRQLAIRATAFDGPLGEARERADATQRLIAEFRRQRKILERSPEALRARAQIAAITRAAEMARLRLVRDAFLSAESLEHTNFRPTAWWLPMVTPGGEWLDAMAAGTKARFEAL